MEAGFATLRNLRRVAERAKVLQHTAERVGERRGARFHLHVGIAGIKNPKREPKEYFRQRLPEPATYFD